LLKQINLIWPVQSCRRKQFVSLTGQITFRTPASRPERGAYRDRHERGYGMRWTRQRRARNEIAGRAFGL
jgi:hypothetical protein